MAVAVKNTPETRAPGLFDRLATASLAGVVYVLGSLGIVFKGLPALWERLGLAGAGFLGTALLVLVAIAALVALAALGLRLLASPPRPGLKAGVFCGLVLVLVLLLLCRWIGGLIEGWAYRNEWFAGNEFTTGGAIAGAICALLALWALRVFFKPRTEARLLRLEEQGWFTAKAFKPGQGLRVRRATMLGILLVAGSGIWVMLQRETFGRDLSGWQINVPFTGRLVVEDYGDAGPGLDKDPPATFEVLSPGSAHEALAEGARVDRDTALAAIGPMATKKKEDLGRLLAELRTRAASRLGIPSTDLDETKAAAEKANNAEVFRLIDWIEQLQRFEGQLGEGVGLFLAQREIDRAVRDVKERERERKRIDPEAEKRGSLNEELALIDAWAQGNALPVVAPVVDRFRARDINKGLDPNLFRHIDDPEPFKNLDEEYRFKKGDVVPAGDFEAAVEQLKQRRARGASGDAEQRLARQRAEEEARRATRPARPMEGRAAYASFTLLPAVQVTVPLLLLGLTLWMAWRIVNLPAFGDFLIATEAELNKVSWTTRSRLYQDTLVVLTTMVLMAAFLFVVDIAWAKLLSSRPIGVLQVSDKPKDDKSEADLKW